MELNCMEQMDILLINLLEMQAIKERMIMVDLLKIDVDYVLKLLIYLLKFLELVESVLSVHLLEDSKICMILIQSKHILTYSQS